MPEGMSRVPQEAIYPKTPIDDILAAEEAELMKKIALTKEKNQVNSKKTEAGDPDLVRGKRFSPGVVGQTYERHESGLDIDKTGQRETVDPNDQYKPKGKIESGLDLDLPN